MYDLLPNSSKLVVLDISLSVRKAVLALVESGVRSCPLWCRARQKFVGMLTVDQLVMLIRENMEQNSDNTNNMTLATWLETNNFTK